MYWIHFELQLRIFGLVLKYQPVTMNSSLDLSGMAAHFDDDLRSSESIGYATGRISRHTPIHLCSAPITVNNTSQRRS